MAGAAASGPRRALGGATAGGRRRRGGRRVAPPLEHRILMTATLCLLAFGAVMGYSASSPLGVLAARGSGYGTGEVLPYLAFRGIGWVAMHLFERRGLALLSEGLVRLMLFGSFGLLLLVMLPGFGVDINGARRWFAAGPIQFQPSEVMKIALVLYVARYLADHPKRFEGSGRGGGRGAPSGGLHNFGGAPAPVALGAGA